MSDLDALRSAVRDVPDFPKPGIIYKDIAPILADPKLFKRAVHLMADTVGTDQIDKIVAVEARGFIFGGAMAHHLGAGFVPLRKGGKLPGKKRQIAYTLEYGESVIELQQDAIKPGEKVLLVDDLLATGGTVAAAVELIKQLDANLIGIAVLVELGFLKGRDKLPDTPIFSILQY